MEVTHMSQNKIDLEQEIQTTEQPKRASLKQLIPLYGLGQAQDARKDGEPTIFGDYENVEAVYHVVGAAVVAFGLSSMLV